MSRFLSGLRTYFTAAVDPAREQGAKDAGKMRVEGKEYVVKDGDVMNFLFSS